MPIYEFKCKTCEDVFEELVPMTTEGDRLTCPTCGAIGARRLISAFAAHGLENGHIAVGRKLTGKGASSGESSESSATAAPAPVEKKAAGCGSGCSCH